MSFFTRESRNLATETAPKLSPAPSGAASVAVSLLFITLYGIVTHCDRRWYGLFLERECDEPTHQCEGQRCPARAGSPESPEVGRQLRLGEPGRLPLRVNANQVVQERHVRRGDRRD